jgi:hypothetical protein
VFEVDSAVSSMLPSCHERYQKCAVSRFVRVCHWHSCSNISQTQILEFVITKIWLSGDKAV